MTINNIPASLQAAIQAGFLETEFRHGLNSALGYRKVADREPIAINVGETITKTRAGLKAPVTTPLLASGNTNLDNGLTPNPSTIEQYTLGMNMYADSIDLNVVTSQVGIANQFLLNSRINGTQARQSLDRIARNALFSAYLGGQTSVRVTLGAPGTALSVDNVAGFLTVLVNGVMVPVSATNSVSVLVGATSYTLVGAAADAVNASVTPGGVSGVLTFSSNVTVANGTVPNQVLHANAPVLRRPSGVTSSLSLTSSNLLTLSVIEDTVAQIRNNTAYMGMIDCLLDNVSMRQLFADPDFKQIYQGQYGSKPANEWRQGQVFDLFGVQFTPTTEALTQVNGSVTIRRPILAIPGALVEGDFAGMTDKAKDMGGVNADVSMIDDVIQITRGPMDRLQQIIAQSWFWIGGFVAPTDVTANSNIIPTAGAQYLKRAGVIEHGS